MKTIAIFCAATAVALSMSLSAPAQAQATRTWVSGVGDDANPCSRTAPCKTFAGAISKTADTGFINCIDPGGFGAVTITKNITIDCKEVHAGVLVAGTNGITISGAGIVVTLRGLSIESPTSSTGLNGINFLNGAGLIVEDCVITGFRDPSTGAGISFTPSGSANLSVINTVMSNNFSGAVLDPGAVGFAAATFRHVSALQNNEGIRATGVGGGGVHTHIIDSVASENAGQGFTAVTVPGGSGVFMGLERAQSSLNGGDGLRSNGGVTVTIKDSSFWGNSATGLNSLNSGQILSYGNNSVFDNTTNGAPTGMVSPM